MTRPGNLDEVGYPYNNIAKGIILFDIIAVDIVVAEGGRLIPLEVKLVATPWPAMARNLTAFQKDLPGLARPGYVIHPGAVRLPLAPGVAALPFREL